MTLELDRGEPGAERERRRRTPTRQSVETRDRILDAAARLFGENGYAATSTRAIATEVGVSPSASYYAIGSKQDLLVAVYNSFVDGWLETMQALLESDLSPMEKLQQYLSVTIQNIEDNHAKMKLFTNEHRSLTGEALAAFIDKSSRVQGVLPLIMQEGVARGIWRADLSAAAAIAIKATASWLVNRYGAETAIPANEAAQSVMQLTTIALAT